MPGIGLSTNYQAALGGTVVNIKAGGGRLYAIELNSANAVSEFLQLFDALAANVTLGTTTPKLSLAIPKGISATDVGIMDKSWEGGVQFNTAISAAVTTTNTGSTGAVTGVDANFFFI